MELSGGALKLPTVKSNDCPLPNCKFTVSPMQLTRVMTSSRMGLGPTPVETFVPGLS